MKLKNMYWFNVVVFLYIKKIINMLLIKYIKTAIKLYIKIWYVRILLILYTSKKK